MRDRVATRIEWTSGNHKPFHARRPKGFNRTRTPCAPLYYNQLMALEQKNRPREKFNRSLWNCFCKHNSISGWRTEHDSGRDGWCHHKVINWIALCPLEPTAMVAGGLQKRYNSTLSVRGLFLCFRNIHKFPRHFHALHLRRGFCTSHHMQVGVAWGGPHAGRQANGQNCKRNRATERGLITCGFRDGKQAAGNPIRRKTWASVGVFDLATYGMAASRWGLMQWSVGPLGWSLLEEIR